MAFTASSTIIFGQTKTGKSYYAKSIAKASSLPTFVVNGQEKDFNSEDGFNHITFEDLIEDEEEVTNCILIIDDIVRPNDQYAKCINKQLVHRKRHNNITTFVIAHGIEKNNLHSMIKHFDYVMFTNSHTNTTIFKSYAKKYCPKDFNESMIKWEDFINNKKKDSATYFRFNTSISEFEIIDIKGNLLIGRDNKLREKVFKYLSPVGETKVSMALFDYLMEVLPAGAISEDLQLHCQDVKSKKKSKISLIDFLHYVTSKKENIIFPPRQKIIQIFKSMQKNYNIPSVFVGNHYF